MLRYSAGYVPGNHNFVIQQIEGALVETKYTSAIYIMKNLLLRGRPTRMSAFLQERLPGAAEPVYLASPEAPRWHKTIKGDEKHGYYPAQTFFYRLLPHYLGEYGFIQALLLPEALITDILKTEAEGFIGQQVDFYLPQAQLVIEIDGSQHELELQHQHDQARVQQLEAHGIETVRISTAAIEAQNQELRHAMQKIMQRCVEFQEELRPYQEAYDEFQINDSVTATAVMRWQLTFLSLLERNILSLEDGEWLLQIRDHENIRAAKLAVEDLFLWLQHLCKLQKLPFQPPKLLIRYTEAFTPHGIRIDFSLRKRWTDELPTSSDVLVVRSDYFEDRDHFSMSVTDPVNYHIIQEGEDSDIPSLHFFLQNFFGFNEFNDGQLSIIMNSLSGRDTIGLLPTGGGKSLCYQFVAMLQPCISFVVVPIKSLMYDQVDNLKSKGFIRTNYVSGDLTAEEKETIQRDFARGKYWFIFISPERFQIREFRQYLNELNRTQTIALAIIDEVHCLSEWGHDFRTSYLHLVRTINRYCPTVRYLGLTATASKNVLKDISVEMNIGTEDVKTLLEYTRPELTFIVYRTQQQDQDAKKRKLVELLNTMQQRQSVLSLLGPVTKSGLIFTPLVNTAKGCFELANDLSRIMKAEVKWYSGQKPKKATMSEEEFNAYKQQVQTDFKSNKFPLLVATKAFGMGIDKPNVRYTIHFGIPGSLESLYQEAGRAGRDKRKAACYVLYDRDDLSEKDFHKLFELNTSMEEIEEVVSRYGYRHSRDILGAFFLWLQNNKGVNHEKECMQFVFEAFAQPNTTKIINCRKTQRSFSELQKAIYRLSLLGIVDDWLVTGWEQNGEFEVSFGDYDESTVHEALLSHIRKYDVEFSLDSEPAAGHRNELYYKTLHKKDISYYERLMEILVQWSYDNITYNRRQALKTLDQLCNDYADQRMDRVEFKRTIENYFCFTENTYILDHIAQAPSEYARWFELFYEENGSMKSEDELKNIAASLTRFLESYRYNTGLNYISGIVRLFLGTYSTLDGKDRLTSAFQQIVTYSENVQQDIFQSTLTLAKRMSPDSKNHISEILCNVFPEQVISIYETLQDDHSLWVILDGAAEKLQHIGGRLV